MVKIKGMGKIEIDPMRARSIKADWSNPAMPRDMRVDLGDVWAGELGEILSFKIPEIRYVDEENLVDKTNREWKEYRKEVQGKSMTERSEMLGLFRLFWFGMTYGNLDWHHTRNEIPEPVIKEAISTQYEFFQKNPKRLVTDPVLFFPILKSRSMRVSSRVVLAIIERAHAADVRESTWESKTH